MARSFVNSNGNLFCFILFVFYELWTRTGISCDITHRGSSKRYLLDSQWASWEQYAACATTCVSGYEQETQECCISGNNRKCLLLPWSILTPLVGTCPSPAETTTHGHPTTTTPIGFSCTLCENITQLCIQPHHVATCPEPYCLNEVTDTADGSKTISRRCGTLRECNSDWWHTTSDDPDCQTYDPNGSVHKYVHCTFCCTTDNCNADIVPKPLTLYTPFGK